MQLAYKEDCKHTPVGIISLQTRQHLVMRDDVDTLVLLLQSRGRIALVVGLGVPDVVDRVVVLLVSLACPE